MNNKNYISIKVAYVIAGVLFSVTSVLLADMTPSDVYGNYVGVGKCKLENFNPCTDTGPMDTLYLQRIDKVETEMEKRIREGYELEKNDTRVSIRILRDYGQSCTFEEEMYWKKDHFAYFPKAPYGEKICKMELWLKDDVIVLKDPGNACSETLCSINKPVIFEGQQYRKGGDPLLDIYRKPASPPDGVFGKYFSTGECAKDEREVAFCRGRSKFSDFIQIIRGNNGDVSVQVDTVRAHLTGKAAWTGNYFVYYNEVPDEPGKPKIMQFWFKGDTVVARDVWGNNGTALFQGVIFKK